MKKILIITLLAGTTTFSLFAFMAFLISSDKVSVTTAGVDIPVVIMTLPEDKPPVIKPPTILTPPMANPPMPSETELPVINEGPGTAVYNPPQITMAGNGIKPFALNGDRDNQARPIVRISPKYPLDAVRNGIEGWVVLAFNINAIGEVVNISVIKSNPKRIFDKAARQALKKWKYQAKKVDGKAVEQQNLTVQLDFTMGQSS